MGLNIRKILKSTPFGESLLTAADAAAARLGLGLDKVANVDTTSADNITSGTLDAARLPDLSGTYQATSGRDQPNGYPGLDANGELVGPIIPHTDSTAVLAEGEIGWRSAGGGHTIVRGDGVTVGGKSVAGATRYVELTATTVALTPASIVRGVKNIFVVRSTSGTTAIYLNGFSDNIEPGEEIILIGDKSLVDGIICDVNTVFRDPDPASGGGGYETDSTWNLSTITGDLGRLYVISRGGLTAFV